MELSQGHTFKPGPSAIIYSHHTRSYPIGPGESLDQWMAHETGEIAAVPRILGTHWTFQAVFIFGLFRGALHSVGNDV